MCRLAWYLCWTNQYDKLLRIRIWTSRKAREWNKSKLKILEIFEASTFPIIFFKKYSHLHNKCICWLNKFRHSTCLVFFFPLLLKLERIPLKCLWRYIPSIWLLFSATRHQGRSDRTSQKPRHILTSFLINYWTDARQHGVYFHF